MADPMTPERLAEIREREQAATPGPWEPGSVWLLAGLIQDDDGKRVPPGKATRCGFCHTGDPVWSGRTRINGTLMNAHRHRNPEPWSIENLISAANGDLVAGNFDYEEGGIIAPADTVFVAAAREDVPALLSEVERLRAELARSDELLVGAHNDLCEAVDSRRTTLAGAVQHAAAVRAERDRLREDAAGWRQAYDRLFGDATRLAEQVQRVRALHAPEDDPRRTRDCKGCRTHVSFTPYEDCKTVRALDGTEATP